MVKFLSSFSILSVAMGFLLESVAAQEIIYLVNCIETSIRPGGRLEPSSRIAYYSDVTKSWNQEYPNAVQTVAGGSLQYVEWETQQVTATFPDKNVVVTTLWNGQARNNYRSFNCQRDSGRQLYVLRVPMPGGPAGFTVTCSSIYYCM
ncbi:hypothetical protein BC829DRAFT_422242 [Chytridium lagenaria]|nr:hypothetical protein BC829DRAFT_422242 [Chytridium lagenaria]